MESPPKTGEINLAYQPGETDDAAEQQWPTFYEKLAHFNTQHPPKSTSQTHSSNESKDEESPKISSGRKSSGNVSDVSSLSKSSNVSNPPSPDRPKSSVVSNVNSPSFHPPSPPPVPHQSPHHHPGHNNESQCHKCLVAMALEEVLKHESESGFVVEISESDRDHKEVLKMIIKPRREEEHGLPQIERETTRSTNSFGTRVSLNGPEELDLSKYSPRPWQHDDLEYQGLGHQHNQRPEAIEEEDEDHDDSASRQSAKLRHRLKFGEHDSKHGHEYPHGHDNERSLHVHENGHNHHTHALGHDEEDGMSFQEKTNAIKLACQKISPGNSSDFSLDECNKSSSESSSKKEEDGEEPHKEEWSSPIEFLLSCIAMSVGLGNVWRFPFTAYENGGGAFLIPYLIVLFFIGRPLYFMELSMGQFSSKSSVRVWDMVPGFRGVGYGQVIANCSVVSYYTSLIALSFYYMCASFSAVLPWTVCDPEVDLKEVICVKSGDNATEVVANMSLPFNTTVMSSAEQYFLHTVLHHKESIEDGLGWPVLSLVGCLATCYIMLFLTLWKGVASSGKVAYFTAIFPYVVLITLLVRGVTLPGSINGIMFYITPKWEQLLNVNVWYQAVTQSFFSLSVGFGALINYSSHNKFRHNIYRDAMIISITDTFTSLLAGFTIFAILGNLAEELDVPIDKVIKSGTGLAFVSYPMALAKFEYGPQVFSVLFFLMLITLGLGSATGLISSVVGIVCDEKRHWNKTLVTFVICLAGFGLGLIYITPGGQHVLGLVDFFGGSFIIFALTTLEVFAVCYIYGLPTFLHDLNFMLDRKLGFYYKFCWGLLIPGALLFFFGYYLIFAFPELGYAGVPFPKIAIYAGWSLAAFAFLQVPYWMLHSMYFTPGNTVFQKFRNSLIPSKEWGPKNKELRSDWISHHSDRRIRIQEKKQLKLKNKEKK